MLLKLVSDNERGHRKFTGKNIVHFARLNVDNYFYYQLHLIIKVTASTETVKKSIGRKKTVLILN